MNKPDVHYSVPVPTELSREVFDCRDGLLQAAETSPDSRRELYGARLLQQSFAHDSALLQKAFEIREAVLQDLRFGLSAVTQVSGRRETLQAVHHDHATMVVRCYLIDLCSVQIGLSRLTDGTLETSRAMLRCQREYDGFGPARHWPWEPEQRELFIVLPDIQPASVQQAERELWTWLSWTLLPYVLEPSRLFADTVSVLHHQVDYVYQLPRPLPTDATARGHVLDGLRGRAEFVAVTRIPRGEQEGPLQLQRVEEDGLHQDYHGMWRIRRRAEET